MKQQVAITYSRACLGIEAPLVTVETHLSGGLTRFCMVGLPETEVKESRDRVRSAVLNSHFEFPIYRSIVNLAPADLPKEGSRFDLAIAIGILAASGQIPSQELSRYEFAGELALTGDLRPIQGSLPFALQSQQANRILILPAENAKEAAMAKRGEILPANNLLEVCAHLMGKQKITPYQAQALEVPRDLNVPDLSDVKGQSVGKRALEIAAAGRHSLLMMGPPGSGKTMLASRLIGLLPLMREDEALEAASIHSLRGSIDMTQWYIRRFRSPHHTASPFALVGGGRPPRPGEISLAHHGVLFLDELPEFSRRTLETLREPLESGCITISRAAHQAQYPAKFQLIAAMNPCPCGYAGDSTKTCSCLPDRIQQYRHRISGPLLDRIDLHIQVNAIPHRELLKPEAQTLEKSETVRSRVLAAHARQYDRQQKLNAALNTGEIENYCALEKTDKEKFLSALERLNVSARVYHRILRVSRTIADLGESESIQTSHWMEALHYRPQQ